MKWGPLLLLSKGCGKIFTKREIAVYAVWLLKFGHLNLEFVCPSPTLGILLVPNVYEG